jgi:hypothetical protein
LRSSDGEICHEGNDKTEKVGLLILDYIAFMQS